MTPDHNSQRTNCHESRDICSVLLLVPVPLSSLPLVKLATCWVLSEHYGPGGEQRHETGTSTDIQDNGESCVKRQVFKNVSDDTIETRGNYNVLILSFPNKETASHKCRYKVYNSRWILNLVRIVCSRLCSISRLCVSGVIGVTGRD